VSCGSKGLIPVVGVAAVSSPLEVGAERAPRATVDLAKLLVDCGCNVVQGGAVGRPEKALAAGRQFAEAHVQAVTLVSTSWFEDYLALDLLEECRVPLLLWSLPGMETGALCGMQQLTAYLKQLKVPYHCVYGPLQPGEPLEAARCFLHAAALRKTLRVARIGFGGHHVTGMTETAVNEIALKKVLGPRVVPLDLPALLNRAGQIPDQQVQSQWRQVVRRSGACKVPEAAGLDAMKVYLAVKELIRQHGLDALTIGCYPHLMGRVCLAASLLADEGIPFGCEGDVNGAVGQLILTLLTGQPTHNTDWLEPLEDGTVVFTHCGSGSFTLAQDKEQITLSPVRLMDQGVCALFPAKPGPVTLLNLLPYEDTYQLAWLEGEAIPTEMVFPGNPVRVRFDHPTPQIIDWIHDEGIGHHWMISYGHVAKQLAMLSRMAAARYVRMHP